MTNWLLGSLEHSWSSLGYLLLPLMDRHRVSQPHIETPSDDWSRPHAIDPYLE